MREKFDNVSAIVIFFFEQGNLQAAKSAIERTRDPKVITDVLNIFVNNKVVDKISIELATLLLDKAALLFENKYKFYIRTAIKYAYEVLKRFTQEIISLKSFSQMSKLDLEREERVKRYDDFLAKLRTIVEHKVFLKLKKQLYAEEIGTLTQALLTDYEYVVSTIRKASE